MEDTIIIRKAVREDMRQVIQLIIELTAFEGFPDKTTITAQDLERDGFDSKIPLFYSIVAECTKTKKLIGQAMYNFAYSSVGGAALYLEDLYVKPEYRSLKIGHKLFKEVCKIGKEMNCIRLDWHVLVHNDKAMKFYLDHGAEDLCAKEKRTCMTLSRDKIKKNADS